MTHRPDCNTHGGEESKYRYTFTILTPTYNRAHTLPRAYDSLKTQGYCDFEWLIIDDGSTDTTKSLVEQWQIEADFHISYYWQENQGKHVAHNTGIRYAQGLLTIILDSDDKLAPSALDCLKQHWDKLPAKQRKQFAGIEGLCADFDGNIVGTQFPVHCMDSNHLEIRKRYGVRGDKKNAVRTDILRKLPFPQFPGEKHIRDSLLWKRISQKYKFRYINEVIQLVEYQPEGLSSNPFLLRTQNPRGFRLYFMEEVNQYGKYDNLWKRLDNYGKYVRYSLHSGIGYRQQWRNIDAPLLWLLSIPKGTLVWLRDKIHQKHSMSENP